MIDAIKNQLREIKDILEMDTDEYYERFIANTEVAQHIKNECGSIYAFRTGVVKSQIDALISHIEIYQKW